MQHATIDEFVDALDEGQIGAMPCETNMLLVCRLDRPGRFGEIFEIKQRPADVALGVLVRDYDEAARLGELAGDADYLARRFWPGPLILVVRWRADAAAAHPQLLELGGDPKWIGFCPPADPTAVEVLRRCGPLVASSANIHGMPPSPTVEGLAESLPGVDLVVAPYSGVPASGVGSTVVRFDDDGNFDYIARQGLIELDLDDLSRRRGKS